MIQFLLYKLSKSLNTYPVHNNPRGKLTAKQYILITYVYT